jgi:hypothetical protein
MCKGERASWIPALLAPSMALALRSGFAVRASSGTRSRWNDELEQRGDKGTEEFSVRNE